MKYTFMAANEREFQVRRMCRVLEVKRSGYYAWRKRKPSTQAQANQALLELIKVEFKRNRKTYGSPRLHVVLHRKGVVCGHNRVARLMRLHGITVLTRRKYRPKTTQRSQAWSQPPTGSIRTFLPRPPTRNGSAISPTSRLAKAGCIWR